MAELKNKIRAMFDIVPAAAENVEAEEINLKQPNFVPEPTPDLAPEPIPEKSETKTPDNPVMSDDSIYENADLNKLMDKIMDPQELAHEELTAVLDQVGEPLAELASIGVVVGKLKQRPEAQLVYSRFSKNEKDEFYQGILDKIREPLSPKVAKLMSSNSYKPEIKLASSNNTNQQKPTVARGDVAEFYNKPVLKKTVANNKSILTPNLVAKKVEASSIKPKTLNFHAPSRKIFFFKKNGKGNRFALWTVGLVMVGLISYIFALKNEVMNGGVIAFQNLEEAGQNLKQFNFSKAADNFGQSYNDFSQASQTMNFMGAGIAGIFGDLPVIGKFKSAKDLVEAGKLIAQSGKAMSEALNALSKTGSILDPSGKNKTKPSKLISQIKDALVLSNKNFQKAKALLADIDESIIPEDKKQELADFKDKIPLLEQYLGNAIEYSDFLEGVVGIDKSQKYLLLFNNYSELRPTGGFPGTYGVVSFAGGGLSNFFVDDVYNLDGQIDRNVIPPKQLQHITPTWGMRDASWFLDFPTSAKKAMSFFAEESGYKVDGVIALDPAIVTGILKVVGPVEMPEYDMTLTADNFVESIQEEVEYGPNRIQPKQVVTDFGPRFLEKLYSADSDKWVKIFDVLMNGLENKDILFYFNNKSLEDFSVEQGFGGEVKKTDADYLTVNFSNIKGSKTDAVTDSSISVDSTFKDGKIIHKVTITRDHKGGDKEHGFYNRQNTSYVRVLVPEEAELLSISGNDVTNFKPLISYVSSGFEKDSDLVKYESSFYADKFPGVDKFSESGYKGIGFWMLTDPGTTKKIEFEYSVPVDYANGKSYDFYFQKQPGLIWKNFKFSIESSSDHPIVGSVPELNKIGNLFIYDKELTKDADIQINFSSENIKQ